MMTLAKMRPGIVAVVLGAVLGLSACVSPRVSMESMVAHGNVQKISRLYVIENMRLKKDEVMVFQNQMRGLLDFCSITSQYGSIEGNFFSDEEHRQALQLLLAKSVHEFGPDHILEINELSSLNEYTPAGVYVKSLGFKYDFIIKDMQNNKIWRAQVNLNTGVDSSPEEIWHALAKKVVVRMQKDGLIRCPEAAE